MGSALELFRKFFGAVRVILWVWGSCLLFELRWPPTSGPGSFDVDAVELDCQPLT